MMTGKQAAQLAASYIGSGPSTFYAYYSRNVSEFRSGDWCACFASCIVMMAGATCVRFKANGGKTLSYYTASTSYGLLAGIRYTYIIVYSS